MVSIIPDLFSVHNVNGEENQVAPRNSNLGVNRNVNVVFLSITVLTKRNQCRVSS